ncbi:hypothetical protein GFS31_41220 (plasmid) [Leptolyngbya sp. BL0902]|uniref:hypothetical protein n=1 Tax=Leptolyngbya sp. BL0902 TaxID=1115757 RepID=UPI0018E8FE4B|nr:hypothetical protein [Leptolyngbya sp. BL0902]QQE67409.1 hypothetical protein GFS31_41220 [Leptolyngbya sp. BL0902]
MTNSTLVTALKAAWIDPETINLARLWQTIEPVLGSLALHEQLAVGGAVIDRLATLHQAKAEALFEQWQAVYDPEDPTLAQDWLRGLVRSSQQLDTESLVASPTRQRPQAEAVDDDGSVVAPVDKATLLAMVDDMEPKQQAIEVAHDEAVGVWVEQLRAWFVAHPEAMEVRQIQAQMGWPLVQVWLGLLLGGFRLAPGEGEFYARPIWVEKGSSIHSATPLFFFLTIFPTPWPQRTGLARVGRRWLGVFLA